MIVFSNTITHRLTYISDFIGKEIAGRPFTVTNNLSEFTAHPGPKINYSNERITKDEVWIKPHPLLFETGIRQQQTAVFINSGNPCFFKTDGDHPFDVFAAIFYLLSRYEEYLPHQNDMYGRYAHESSLAFKENFLSIPLVNYWLQDLGELLQRFFVSYTPIHSSFTFIPTYDIDEAYSFKYKSWWRSAGAAIKDILKGKFDRFVFRRQVLNKKANDPFDSFDWIDDLHRPYSFKSQYFFLVAGKTGKYDKNILPSETALQTLIKKQAEKYDIGVHPSWQSGDNISLLKKEIETLERISQKKITASRQHFIRFTLPATYHQLIDAGIRKDYSMGYGSINGFRASVASPFYWYDLQNERATDLQLFPFCYMEANSFYEQHFTPQQALAEMRSYYAEVKKVNGTMITIWHNTFLGTDKRFEGWREVYAQFIKEIS